MVPNKDKGYSVDPITRDDLDKAVDRCSDDIKEHINLLISPIIDTQNKVEIILRGKTGMNGLVGTVKTLATNLKVIYGMLAFLATAVCGAVVKKVFF